MAGGSQAQKDKRKKAAKARGSAASEHDDEDQAVGPAQNRSNRAARSVIRVAVPPPARSPPNPAPAQANPADGGGGAGARISQASDSEDVECSQDSGQGLVDPSEIPVSRRSGEHARALLQGAGERPLEFDKIGVSGRL